jgi:hypothetical protein
MTNTVYILDKAIGEVWTDKEIGYLVNEYGVEVEQLPAIPFRLVAMNAPTDSRPIDMTWRAKCMLQECEAKDRWAADESFSEPSRRFEGIAGNLIVDMIGRMIALVSNRLGTVVAELNGVEVVVKNGDTVEERWDWMQAEQERKREAYLKSPEYKERCRLDKIKADKNAADRAAILAVAPEHMSLKDEPGWRKSVEVNADSGYGAAVTRYAEKWARFMEAKMVTGSTVADCADACSHLADDEGITGFMYDCAVSILAQVWTHGEALRRWHNKNTQIGIEDDKANETGGVLNPALFSIG